MNTKILCPKCNWKPDGGEYWQCSCLYDWNTFNTGGRCPNCSKVWKLTQCPGPGLPGGCGIWSPHSDWYRDLDIALKAKEALQKRVKNKPAKPVEMV